jgi:predicted Zn-dependent protease
LLRKFPGSPRVAVLEGMLCEGKGDIKGAKVVYGALLDKDETNVVSRMRSSSVQQTCRANVQSAHQREIALLLPDGPAVVIPYLVTYLDTFYTDAAGWALLADQYAEAGMHAQALTALGHVMLINAWDSDAVERAGAVAYTLG